MTDRPVARRQIDIGAVLNRIVETYSATARTLILGALIVFVPVALVSALTRNSVLGSALAALVSLIASTWYAGMVVKTVQDVQDGRVDSPLGELFSSVTPVLWQLILVGFVAGLGIAVGLVLLIVPGLILLTIWAVAPPVVVLENPGVFASLRRSRELVRGNGWQVFGVIVAIFAVILVVSLVIGSIGAIGDSFVLVFVVDLALRLLLAPVYALASAVLYFALRAAHEQSPAPPGGFEPPAPGFEPPAPPPAGGSVPPPGATT